MNYMDFYRKWVASIHCIDYYVTEEGNFFMIVFSDVYNIDSNLFYNRCQVKIEILQNAIIVYVEENRGDNIHINTSTMFVIGGVIFKTFDVDFPIFRSEEIRAWLKVSNEVTEDQLKGLMML